MTDEAVAIGEIIFETLYPAWYMFSIDNVVGYLAIIVSFTVGLVFMWWGLRKAVSALMSAFRKGKVSL